MSCIVIVTTTKPVNVAWNHHTLSTQHELYRIWLEKFPGFISKSGREVTPDCWENTFIFDSRASWDKFLEDKKDLDWWKDMVRYNTDHGISSVVEFQN